MGCIVLRLVRGGVHFLPVFVQARTRSIAGENHLNVSRNHFPVPLVPSMGLRRPPSFFWRFPAMQRRMTQPREKRAALKLIEGIWPTPYTVSFMFGLAVLAGQGKTGQLRAAAREFLANPPPSLPRSFSFRTRLYSRVDGKGVDLARITLGRGGEKWLA